MEVRSAITADSTPETYLSPPVFDVLVGCIRHPRAEAAIGRRPLLLGEGSPPRILWASLCHEIGLGTFIVWSVTQSGRLVKARQQRDLVLGLNCAARCM